MSNILDEYRNAVIDMAAALSCCRGYIGKASLDSIIEKALKAGGSALLSEAEIRNDNKQKVYVVMGDGYGDGDYLVAIFSSESKAKDHVAKYRDSRDYYVDEHTLDGMEDADMHTVWEYAVYAESGLYFSWRPHMKGRAHSETRMTLAFGSRVRSYKHDVYGDSNRHDELVFIAESTISENDAIERAENYSKLYRSTGIAPPDTFE